MPLIVNRPDHCTAKNALTSGKCVLPDLQQAGKKVDELHASCVVSDTLVGGHIALECCRCKPNWVLQNMLQMPQSALEVWVAAVLHDVQTFSFELWHVLHDL